MPNAQRRQTIGDAARALSTAAPIDRIEIPRVPDREIPETGAAPN